MKAGLAAYRVGDFVPGASAKPPFRPNKSYVKLDLPPDGDEQLATEFNNRLVKLCRVTYSAFLDAAKAFDFVKVRQLVDANVEYVNVQPSGRWTAIHQARRR